MATQIVLDWQHISREVSVALSRSSGSKASAVDSKEAKTTTLASNVHRISLHDLANIFEEAFELVEDKRVVTPVIPVFGRLV